MIVGKLQPGDRTRWAELWEQYLGFYATTMPPEIYDFTWQRLLGDREMHAFVARDGDQIAGVTHFLYHASGWTLTPVCYLQDLFTAPEHRNKGAARALIAAVADHARAANTTRMYWLTQSTNATARALYDKVAKHSGFIRYEYPL